jgi:tRNA pseudouridine55 synthase
MDGLLVVDKPSGPTSHDVVARVRRALRERRVGHTGTLDPAATGVLPLVVGRATRLAQFLSGSDKSYAAVIRFGFSTDTGDAQGRALGIQRAIECPSRAAIDAALDAFRGEFLQQPPAFSAKKIDGKRSHELARARARADARLAASRSTTISLSPSLGFTSPNFGAAGSSDLPDPVSVTAFAIEVVSTDGDSVTIRVDCSAGFYIRSLAHDLGERLGVGGHLVALRRTRSGTLTLADAVALDAVEREPALAAGRVIPLANMLPGLAPVVLTSDGVRKAIHGRELGPEDCVSGFATHDSELARRSDSRITSADSRLPTSDFRIPAPESRLYRLLDRSGQLVAIARPASAAGLLHPSVVLV